MNIEEDAKKQHFSSLSTSPSKTNLHKEEDSSKSSESMGSIKDDQQLELQLEGYLFKRLKQGKNVFKILKNQKRDEQVRFKIEFFLCANYKYFRLQIQEQERDSNEHYQKTSLDKISQMFFEEYLNCANRVIYLDQLSQILSNNLKNTEIKKRRIYDLINITESMNLVKKMSKNTYLWLGFDHIFQDCQQKIQRLESKYLHCQIRKQNSLQYIAYKFKNVFSENQPFLTLDTIYDKLFPNNKENVESKKRRIYDIAKIFKKLGLIKKLKNLQKGTGYLWIGKQGLKQFEVSLKDPTTKIKQQQSNLQCRTPQEWIKQASEPDLIDVMVERFKTFNQIDTFLNNLKQTYVRKSEPSKKSAFRKCIFQ